MTLHAVEPFGGEIDPSPEDRYWYRALHQHNQMLEPRIEADPNIDSAEATWDFQLVDGTGGSLVDINQLQH